ncbi:hypothetical protein PpBr36_04482 [Pyricularia pennisetigena]|uniref:hypothetical protein n=1 Tax=Pyricularia pennisetigena TaxID=1578925 RepID=UPI0011523083|nr:hypothetical protein PpBr36_04482 [Pyricularia pennisetigena]TLS26481.1 hypothetical protein PpBr36_04482 [Pyricularia pennisetigena]
METLRPTRSGLPESLTAGNLPSLLAPLAFRQELSSNTWASSTADMALLSDNDEISDRDALIEDYNRLSKKYGVRLMVPDDYNSGPCTIPQSGKKKWYSRRRGSSTRLPSAKSDKSITHRPSLGDLPSRHEAVKQDSGTDKSLQGLVRLTGKCFLHLPAEYAPGSLIIPTCLRATSQYLVQHGSTARGIFRVPGSVRAVAALYDYYFANTEPGGGTISGTVRTPSLPIHIEYGVHDVASTFKKLLGGLPGGILGSLSVFDALVAIHSHFNGDPESNRTRQTKLRARLIALAIGTLKSQFQRELVCAVFGLLCLIGRTSEMSPREDAQGRPLPTSDLMGYNALGIVFGPLLVGDLIDQYSMQVAEPGAGLILLPATPTMRKDKAKRRAVSEGRPVTPVTIDKIIVANSIAEMLIANWREVVRHMKSLGVIHKVVAGQLQGESSQKSLKTSISEPSLSEKASHTLEGEVSSIARAPRVRKNNSSVLTGIKTTTGRSDQEETTAKSLTVKKRRQSSKPRTVVFANSPVLTSAQLELPSSSTKKELAKRRPHDIVLVQDEGLSLRGSDDSGIAVPTPASTRASARMSTASVTFMTPNSEDRKMSRRASSAQPSASPFGSPDGSNMETPAQPSDMAKGATPTTSGILSKASRAIAKFTTAHRGSRVASPLFSEILTPRKSSDSGVRRSRSARSESSGYQSKHEGRPSYGAADEQKLTINITPAPDQSIKSFKTRVVTEAGLLKNGAATQMNGAGDDQRTGDAERTFDITGSARLVPRAQVDEVISPAMVGRSNAIRQNRRSIGQNSKLASGDEILAHEVIIPDSGSRKPKAADNFHMRHEDVNALRDRGSPTPCHEDMKRRVSRSKSKPLADDQENLTQHRPVGVLVNSQKINGTGNSRASSLGRAVDMTGRFADEFDGARHLYPHSIARTESISSKPSIQDHSKQGVLNGSTAIPPSPSSAPHYASIPGTGMRRKYVSVSGGNVRAMAAIFENAAKDAKTSSDRQDTAPATESNSQVVHVAGSGNVLPQYVRNSTPTTSLRTTKSWISDDLPFTNKRSPFVSFGASVGYEADVGDDTIDTGLPDNGVLFPKGDGTTEMITASQPPANVPVRHPSRNKSEYPSSKAPRAFRLSDGSTNNGRSFTSPLSKSSEGSARIDALQADIYGLQEQLAAKASECEHVRSELLEAQSAVASATTTARAMDTLTAQLRQAFEDAKHWRNEAGTWRARAEATERRLVLIRGQVADSAEGDTSPLVPTSTAMMPISRNRMHQGLQKKRVAGPLRENYEYPEQRRVNSRGGYGDIVGQGSECDWQLDDRWQREDWRVGLDDPTLTRSGKAMPSKEQSGDNNRECGETQGIRLVGAVVDDRR